MTSLYLNDEPCEFSCLFRAVKVIDLSHKMIGAGLDRDWLIKKKKKIHYGKSFHGGSLSLKSSQKM